MHDNILIAAYDAQMNVNLLGPFRLEDHGSVMLIAPVLPETPTLGGLDKVGEVWIGGGDSTICGYTNWSIEEGDGASTFDQGCLDNDGDPWSVTEITERVMRAARSVRQATKRKLRITEFMPAEYGNPHHTFWLYTGVGADEAYRVELLPGSVEVFYRDVPTTPFYPDGGSAIDDILVMTEQYAAEWAKRMEGLGYLTLVRQANEMIQAAMEDLS